MRRLPISRFLALPAAERAAVVEAVLWLLLVRLVLGLLPFRWALRLLGVTPAGAEVEAGDSDAAAARAAARAIARAARRVPFRAVCLQQSFAALLMLRRRGVAATVYLGVARDPAEGMTAHAWSRCGPVAVTGGGPTPRFTPVAMFR